MLEQLPPLSGFSMKTPVKSDSVHSVHGVHTSRTHKYVAFLGHARLGLVTRLWRYL